MTVDLQSVQLLLRDLDTMLDQIAGPAAQRMRRRITTFRMMHILEEYSMLGNVLLLLGTSGEYYVCTEYNEADSGRCQVVCENPYYANFHRDTMSLEYRKSCIEIAQIVYEGSGWPADLSPTRESVLKHFGV